MLEQVHFTTSHCCSSASAAISLQQKNTKKFEENRKVNPVYGKPAVCAFLTTDWTDRVEHDQLMSVQSIKRRNRKWQDSWEWAPVVKSIGVLLTMRQRTREFLPRSKLVICKLSWFLFLLSNGKKKSNQFITCVCVFICCSFDFPFLDYHCYIKMHPCVN